MKVTNVSRKKGQSEQASVSSEVETVATRVETTESSKGICTKGFTLLHNCVRFPPTISREEPLIHFADLQLEDYLLWSFDSS